MADNIKYEALDHDPTEPRLTKKQLRQQHTQRKIAGAICGFVAFITILLIIILNIADSNNNNKHHNNSGNSNITPSPNNGSINATDDILA